MKIGDKVYLTKYALTSGIEIDTIKSISDGGYLFLKERPHTCYSDKEVFKSKKDAVAKVKDMIKRKRASIKKGLAKLDKLEKDLDV